MTQIDQKYPYHSISAEESLEKLFALSSSVFWIGELFKYLKFNKKLF